MHRTLHCIVLLTLCLGAANVAHSAAPNTLDPMALSASVEDAGKAVKTLATLTLESDHTSVEVLRKFFMICDSDTAKQSVITKLTAVAGNAKAKPHGRHCAINLLGVAGAESAVPALGTLGSDPKFTTQATEALLRIGTPAAATALRDLLATTKSPVGFIMALGQLRDAKAAGAIAKHLSGDTPAGKAAIIALGRIGTTDAANALLAAKATTKTQRALASAQMQCGQHLLATNPALAASLFEDVKDIAPTTAMKSLAHLALFSAWDDAKKSDFITAALKKKNPADIEFALRAIRFSKLPSNFRLLADSLPGMPAATQLKALSALQQAPRDASIAKAAAPLTESKTPAVAAAALAALGQHGDKTTVALLATKLQTVPTVKVALTRLDGDGVNAAILAAMKTATGKDKAALIDVLAARGQRKCTADLLAVLASDDRYAAKAACEALATLGDKAACTTLIEMVAGTKPASASKSRLRMAAVQIADRVKFNISAAAKTALASANPDGKRDLLLLLKADGSAEALTTAASLLNDATLRIDAIRTLADWDTPAAVEPLAAVLNKSLSNRERFLTVNAIAGHLPKAPAASRPAHAATVFTNLKTLLADADLGNAAINRLLTAIPAIAYYAHDEARAAADVAAKANPKLAPILNELLSQSLTRNLAKSAIATAPLNYRKDGQSSGPAAANDGDMTTYWDEENGKKRYRLRLTFPTKKTVGSIVLYGYKHHNFAPKTFRINSDAGTLAVVKTAKYTNNRFELPLKPATVKWVELNITGYYGPSPGIREVELYAPDTAPTKAAPKGLSWKQGKDTITLRNDGKTVWQYNYGAKLTKPYFSPIGPINAGDLSWIKPPDHIWHYGLWLSWKTINGINYWEERPAGFTKKKSAGKPTRKTAKRPTRKTPAPLASKGDPKPEGTTKIVSTQVAANADHSAKITQTLVYHPAKTPEAIVLREERTIAVSAPDNHGGYTLDWTMKFTAAVDVVLDRTPISGPNGKPHGGYAGLSMRFAKNFTDWHVIAIDSDKTNLDLTHKPSKGMDFSGTLDGKPCGMAMLDHPTNPRYPSPWYVVLKPEKSFSYFNAAILCHEPMTIKKGQTVTLRYRVAVHNGQWTADQLNAAEATYRATASANAPRALILTGANNHKWQETTPVLKAILETDNAFEVDVVTSPKGLDAKTLSIYDLIVSNWNSWVKRQSMANLEALWTPAARKAFEAAIASGTGHLTVHAGGSSFYDGTWPAYRKITLAYWEKDKTHHGKPLQFKLSLAKTDHPLAKTLKPFSHVDELWEEPGVAEGATVVMTATANNKTHANALAGQFKKGRCAATFLGHDAQKMAAPEFKTHLLTLAQWATRSKETTHAK